MGVGKGGGVWEEWFWGCGVLCGVKRLVVWLE